MPAMSFFFIPEKLFLACSTLRNASFLPTSHPTFLKNVEISFLSKYTKNGIRMNSELDEKRSRHTSGMSCLSYDSAIGDIYSVQTPKSASSDYDNPESPSQSDLQKEVHGICVDLSQKFSSSFREIPKRSLVGDDPLRTAINYLNQSLFRLRRFLFSLEPVLWLPESDRISLYNSHVCSVSILKASFGYDVSLAPPAYPLPYGEYLGDVEALHLILAHDLYNELRSLLTLVQELEITELPVMLLIIMIAFFTPSSSLRDPDKVIRVHDYYVHKLQVYLKFRHGSRATPLIMTSIMNTIDKVRNFSARFREFLIDVTRAGLQKQYESVCENIGLMAFLLQLEPLSMAP